MQNKERMYEKCILSFFLFVNFLEYFFFAYIHPLWMGMVGLQGLPSI